jgi:hypothetical protein
MPDTREHTRGGEGRALDARIAVELMGWRRRDGQHAHAGTPPGEPDEVTRPVPHYSTDIAAAWSVMEVMQKRGLYPRVLAIMSGRWCCEVAGIVGGARGVDAASAPLAICRAALLAFPAHPSDQRSSPPEPAHV